MLAVPPMRIAKEKFINLQTQVPLFRIDVSSAAGSLSSKSLLTVVRTATGVPTGTVRFHSMSDDEIDLSVNGRDTRLKKDGTFNFRWYFKPTVFPGVKWWWTKSKFGGLQLTEDKGGGKRIASLTGDVLVVEHMGLTEMAVDEVVLATVAIWKTKKRESDDEDAVEGLEAIGNIASLVGGGGA